MKPTTKHILLCLLCLALPFSGGCGNGNIIDPLDVKAVSWLEDKFVIEFDALKFDAKKPLSEPPVVEYLVLANKEEGTDEISFQILLLVQKKAGSHADALKAHVPKDHILRAEVAVLDNSRFSVTIPVGDLSGKSVTFFVSDKFIDGKKIKIGGIKPGKSTEDNQVSEPEENEG